jgi:glycosyltransferase involved in cell wall biosynthesis
MVHGALSRVVHVSSAHPWTDNRIHYRECHTLAVNGYDVTLVAVETPVRGEEDDVRVVTLPRTKRIVRMTLGTLRAVRAALKTGAQVFHLHDPELIWAIALLRALGKVVVYDAHEDLPKQILDKDYLRGPIRRSAVAASRVLVFVAGRTATRVVAATEEIARRYPSLKVRVVKNYPPVDPDEVVPECAERASAAVYIGGLSEARGGRIMLEAVMHPDWPVGWKLVVAGSGNERLLASLSDPAVADRVSFLGQIPPQAARLLLREVRVGLVVLQDVPAYRFSLPTKMFEYFEAGLPVIASDFPLWRSIIEANDCGRLVDQTSPAAVAAAVAEYARDDGLCSRQGGNARRMAVEEYNWAREGRTLVDLYAEMTT